MTILIIAFGCFMLIAGIVLIAKPEAIFKVLQENSEQLWLHIAAIVVRLSLGALLITQASASKFPLTMHIIGWVAIVAALIFAAIGREKFSKLVSWAFSSMKPFGLIGGVLALFFGVLLIYAFV